MTAAEGSIGTVAQLWRFPVKSMQGQPVERVEIDGKGVVGDRAWAVVDVAADKVLSGKRWPMLLQATARFAGGESVVVDLPDGTSHEAGDPETDSALSTWLEADVRLIHPPDGPGMHYELPTEAWDDTSEPWEFPGPPGGPFVDLAAAHLLTTASLGAAAALQPDGQWDVRRFRPTALLDVGGDGFVEDDWVGSQVHLGDAAVAPFMPTVRCAMITRPQPARADLAGAALVADPGIARTLRDGHGLNLGVYCGVSVQGTVTLGDPVRIA